MKKLLIAAALIATVAFSGCAPLKNGSNNDVKTVKNVNAMEDSSIYQTTSSQVQFNSEGKVVTMEVFRPVKKDPSPMLIMLHGAEGLNENGSKYREAAKYLASRGFVTSLIHYMDSTEQNDVMSLQNYGPWKKAVMDGITKIGDTENVVKDKVGLVGFSLGSIVEFGVAAEDARVKAIVDYFGTLPPMVRGPRVPTLIFHGDKDEIIPVSEAYDLGNVLKDLGTPYEIKIYPGEKHGFSDAAMRQSMEHAAKFLSGCLK